MKLSARFSQIFALLVITLTFAHRKCLRQLGKSTANYGDPQGTRAPTRTSPQPRPSKAQQSHTPKPALKPQNILLFC